MPAEYAQSDQFRGARIHLCDLAGLEIRDCEVSGLKIVDCYGGDVYLGGDFERLVVNDVDVTVYVEAELDRQHPTRVLAREHSHPDSEMLAQACAVLADAAQMGLCGGWGVSSWDPRPLVDLDAPRPDVLMVRSGLLVGVDVLGAAEALVTRWRPAQVWGMSPFGGSTTQPVWEQFDPRTFLRHSPRATRVQAAFRSAYVLPRVDAVAVGTDNVDHLRELIGALAYEVDDQVVREYRQLLQARRQSV
ncbi:hypothetical protein [Sphaerisporangium sp. NPDC051011]|uniref:hypothetical protein n=1 Tax=Sphaerisporangium sp. NPDC051011 TaxID=3155792 RepID=UPI0033FE4370